MATEFLAGGFRGRAVVRLVMLGWYLIAGLAVAGPAAPAGTGMQRVAVPGEDTVLRGQLRMPAGDGVHPGALLLHGWLPKGTDGAEQMAGLAEDLAARGWAALTMAMRGWPPTGGADDCGLLQTRDALAALAWLGARPEVDAGRTVLVGHSQGGQVALLAAAEGAPAGAVVAYAPVTDLRLWRQTTHIAGIRDYVSEECSAGPGLRARSPIAHVADIEVPVLVRHGAEDRRVSLLQSRRFVAALRKQGVEAELRVYPQAGHGWWELGEAAGVVEWLEAAVR